MKQDDMTPDEGELFDALRTLAREDERLATPPRVEERLMRAFDETHAGARQPRWLVRHVSKVAAVFVLAVAGGYWWSRGGAGPTAAPDPAESPALVAPWPSSETLAWLDPDPESLQIVHVRIPSTALAAQGYAFEYADGDGLVELEVIVGADGMTRGVRLDRTASVIY
jgi:hypothetical protein